MTNEEILIRSIEKLKEQVCEIENNYLREEDIDGKYLPVDGIDGYVKSSDFEAENLKLNDTDKNLQRQIDSKIDASVLDDYLKKSDYQPSENGGVSESWVDERITSKLENGLSSIIDAFFKKLENIENNFSGSIGESKDSIKEDIVNYITTQLEDYLKNDELKYKLEGLGYIDKASIYEYVKNYVTQKLSNIDGLSRDELLGFARKEDIPVKVSQLINDKGYLTQHQSLSEYVRRPELKSYVTRANLDVEINSRMREHVDIFKSEVNLEGLASENWVTKNFLSKSDRTNLSGYVKTSDLQPYAKKSDLPDFEDFLKKGDSFNLDGYLKIEDIESLGFAKKEDLPDENNFVTVETYFEKLKNYVRKEEFDSYATSIETKGYILPSTLEKYLTNYVKKSDLSSGVFTESKIKELISKSIGELKIPQKVSDLLNDKNYLTEHQSLYGYVKRDEIAYFITENTADTRYLKVEDFVLPLDLVYKNELDNYTLKDDFNNLKLDVVRKSQLNNYVTISEFERRTSTIENDIKFNYVRLTDFEKVVENLTGLSDISNNFLTASDLEDYVRVEDFDGFKEYANTNYLTKIEIDAYGQRVDDKLSAQKSWVNEYFLKKADAAQLIGEVPTIDERIFDNYYTKEDIQLRFLSKEDYRGIKRAATINTEYNEYPDLFFSVLQNHDNIMLNDGFYVVGGKAYIVVKNRIIPVTDRYPSIHWVIETEDEDWRYEDKEIIN